MGVMPVIQWYPEYRSQTQWGTRIFSFILLYSVDCLCAYADFMAFQRLYSPLVLGILLPNSG